LGVTPSAWNLGKAIEVGAVGNSIWGNGAGNIRVLSNAYYNGAFKYATSAAASQYTQDGGTHAWSIAPSWNGTGSDAISFTQVMTLSGQADVSLLLGTTSAAYSVAGRGLFEVNGSSSALIAIKSGDTARGYFAAGSTATELAAVGASQPLLFTTNSAERARITAGGYSKFSNNGTYRGAGSSYHEFVSNADNNSVLVLRNAGANATQYGMAIETANDQNDATRYFLSCLGSTTERATIRSDGGLANYSANNVNLASDERLKKDISPLASTWGKVKGIEVVNYRYKDCNEGDPLLYGVIAQQVQPIVPDLVVVTREATETKPEYYGIREQPMYWLAIKALQEAMARIEQLEAKFAALESK
jgi:hypothetical protein